MKVLHLINNLRREGAQVMLFNLVASSVNGDMQYVVCTREPGGQMQPDFQSCGIPVFSPSRYYGASQTRDILHFLDQIIEKEATDLVHAHMADAAFLGWLAARRRAVFHDRYS